MTDRNSSSNQKLHCKGCEAWDRIEAQYAELSRKYGEQRDDYERLRAALLGVMECSGTGTRHYHIARDALRGAVETKSVSEPPPGLLMSMALRMDHALSCPGYYDQPMFGRDGPTHQQRLDSALTVARQMWEEVAGVGFYRPEREAEYVAMRDLKAGERTP